MKTTRILQIGDIHLPEWAASETDVDEKDPKFSKDIIEELKHSRLSEVLKSINKAANSGHIDAVFLMGDLTSYGDKDFIEPAMQIMHTLLQDTANADSPKVYVVPGNHDVNRDDAAKLGTLGKFSHFRETAEAIGWASPPVEGAICFELPKTGPSDTSLTAILVNTSIGSQSLHMLSPSIEQSVKDSEQSDRRPIEILSKDAYDNSAEAPDFGKISTKDYSLSEQRYRHLDTPYVSKEAMANIIQAAGLSEGSCILMCAHHNLLPQRTPRISPYAEMLNAGFFRSALLDSNKNYIYLHGHIHDDPIEIIERPSHKFSASRGNSIVTISAPPIWKGYNEIALFHDHSGDVFLVRITLHRLNASGYITNFDDQSTRFIPLMSSGEILLSSKMQSLWSLLKTGTRTFSEIEIDGGTWKGSELENALMNIFCSGLIEIKNLGLKRHRWRITAIGDQK